MLFPVQGNSDVKNGGQSFWQKFFPDLHELLFGKANIEDPPAGPAISKASKVKKTGAAKKPARLLVKKAVIARSPIKTASDKKEKNDSPLQLERALSNPILKPHELNEWESQATFNPAAIYADGKVHLIYRAVGRDNVSVLGYAMSHNGRHIHERLADPAYYSKTKNEIIEQNERLAYISGGGWNGGCEDPRTTLIDDVVYLLYTAFDGWGSVRIAMSTIALDDFLNKRWNWEEPVLISPPGEINKNWVMFPEKVNGKFAILHSVSPTVRIDYFDSMDELRDEDKFINSKYVKSARRKSWDSWVRGAGPPPIKTKYGWLLLYHAMDVKDPDRYKLGAMLLDLKDPTKILYRSNAPVLEPDECYENEGFKAGVVYACGAVVLDGKLFVYYGGADAVTCVATADLAAFLKELMTTGAPKVRGVAKPKRKVYDHGKALKKKPARLA